MLLENTPGCRRGVLVTSHLRMGADFRSRTKYEHLAPPDPRAQSPAPAGNCLHDHMAVWNVPRRLRARRFSPTLLLTHAPRQPFQPLQPHCNHTAITATPTATAAATLTATAAATMCISCAPRPQTGTNSVASVPTGPCHHAIPTLSAHRVLPVDPGHFTDPHFFHRRNKFEKTALSAASLSMPASRAG